MIEEGSVMTTHTEHHHDTRHNGRDGTDLRHRHLSVRLLRPRERLPRRLQLRGRALQLRACVCEVSCDAGGLLAALQHVLRVALHRLGELLLPQRALATQVLVQRGTVGATAVGGGGDCGGGAGLHRRHRGVGS
jgi:hypothetical protein